MRGRIAECGEFMNWRALSIETKGTALLTTRFGKLQDDFKPLSPSAFRTLQGWLTERSLSVGELLQGDHSSIIEDLTRDGIEIPSITLLLDRIPALMHALERWSEMGIWVVGESDSGFPMRLKQRLHNAALPLLFGAGPIERLGNGGVYIVGSRDSSAEAIQFAIKLAKRCSSENITVISSDMRGVDREAIGAALESGGRAICVLSNSLETAVVTRRHRDFIRAGYLTLVTPFSPDTRFRVANAMRVNRYQYCLSDLAVIVETRREGGVWLGAEENRKESWVPSFVRQAADIPLGNQALLNLGLMPLADHELGDSKALNEYFIHRVVSDGEEQRMAPGPGDNTDKFFMLFCQQLSDAILAGLGTKSDIKNSMGIETTQFDVWISRALNEGIITLKSDGESFDVVEQNRNLAAKNNGKSLKVSYS